MTRKERLQKLADEYHRGKYGDYNDTYEQFAAAYGLVTEDSEYDICDVCGEERHAKVHTDTELHPDDAVDGLTLHSFAPAQEETEPIPRYVTTAHDETYSMLSTWNSIDDALAGLLSTVGNDTLNIPGYLIDLDTGDVLDYSMSIKATGKTLEVNHLDYLKEN